MKKLFLVFVLSSFAVCAEQININQADAETISRALNGIGPKKAEAIVQYRNQHGDFATLKDLENVSGIGEKTIQINEKDILFSSSSPKTSEVDEKKPGKQEKNEPVKKTK